MRNFEHSQRSRTTQTDILDAVVKRLREITGFNDSNAIVTDQVIPEMFATGGGGNFLTVSFGDSKVSMQAASHATTCDNASLLVGVFKGSNTSRPGRAETKLLGSQSLFETKRQVLKYLLVEDPALGASSPSWEPAILQTNSLWKPLLRQPLVVLSATQPSDVPNHQRWIGLIITFSALFDWDLYR